MMNVLGIDNKGTVVLRTSDGMMVFVSDEGVILKNIPSRKKSERKKFEFCDMIAVNDAIKSIYTR